MAENELEALAVARNREGILLSSRGFHEEALAAATEAVTIFRKLTELEPNQFFADLAGSLTNLGNRLSAVGRKEEALAAAAESLAIRRRIAAAHPDAFLSELAQSLNNLSNRLGELGRHDEALDAAAEALGVYRRLAEEQPEAYAVDLARSMGTLANATADDRQGSVILLEGIRKLRPVFEKAPSAHGDLMQRLLKAYRSRCRAAGLMPDVEVREELAPVIGQLGL